ncbi:MAG: hypothetical protein NTX45_07170 [Proteobacteria bacterium]|nr:hypothetical protein [Pseudomonadota bacterium]
MHPFELLQSPTHDFRVIGRQRVINEVFESGAGCVEIQDGVNMRVISPTLLFFHAVAGGVHHADLRVVLALVVVAITDDLLGIVFVCP